MPTVACGQPEIRTVDSIRPGRKLSDCIRGSRIVPWGSVQTKLRLSSDNIGHNRDRPRWFPSVIARWRSPVHGIVLQSAWEALTIYLRSVASRSFRISSFGCDSACASSIAKGYRVISSSVLGFKVYPWSSLPCAITVFDRSA